ncbi:MAG: family 16 glycoside hydrolase, partial [bacterium]
NGDTAGSITRPVRRAMRPTPGDIFFDDFNSGKMSEEWHLWNPSAAWSVEDSSAKGNGNYSRHYATVGAGDVSWTNYRFQMNTKLEGSTNPYIQYLKSYLFFRIPIDSDTMNTDTMYYRFGIKGDESRLTLFRRDGLNKWTWLGAYDFPPRKDVWYNLAIRVQGGGIRCFLNGEEVINKSDSTFSTGGIGIGINEDNMTNYYDDILVRPLVWPDTLFFDNFNSGQMSRLWNKRLGNWDIPQGSGFVRASGSAHFATVGEGCDWTNFKFSVKIRIKGSETVSSLRAYMFFRVQDTLNYYRFGVYSDSGIVLHKRVDGNWQFITKYKFEPEKDVWYNFKVENKSDSIKCYLNDTLCIAHKDTNNPFINGGIGIGVLEQEGMVVDYDDVLVQRVP